ncbi:MAG: hypothetical protein Q9190_001691 [Brigantiaea leucoxantha]
MDFSFRHLAENARPSLANMTLGTTFAAKARAAELNAARSRKVAKDQDDEDDLTASATASLGGLKFTKPRNKGRTWTKLDLNEIPETSLQQEANTEGESPQFRTDTQGFPSVRVAQPYNFVQHVPQNCSYIRSDHASNPHNLAQILANINSSQRNSSEQLNRGSAAYTGSGEHDPFVDSSRDGFSFVDLGSPLGRSGLVRNNINPGLMMSYEAQSTGTQPYKSTISDQNYYSISPPPSLSEASAYPPSGSSDVVRGTASSNISNEISYQRDPLPYTGYTNTRKKEMLLQNLQNVVESSKVQGDLLSSTRTVLYDPMARDDLIQSQDPVRNSRLARSVSECDKEVLKASDPLPWKNRPVNIFNATPSATSRFELANSPFGTNASASPIREEQCDANQYIWSLVPQPETPTRRLQKVNEWWSQDGRGEERLMHYLSMVADEHQRAKAKIESSKHMGNDRQKMQKSLGGKFSSYDSSSDCSELTEVPEQPSAGDITNRLLIPVLINLHSYVNESEALYFKNFGKPHAWCVDPSSEGNKSFFGGDWGQPPNRVGRDPRYRPTYYDGRYTIFEPHDGRVAEARDY